MLFLGDKQCQNYFFLYLLITKRNILLSFVSSDALSFLLPSLLLCTWNLQNKLFRGFTYTCNVTLFCNHGQKNSSLWIQWSLVCTCFLRVLNTLQRSSFEFSQKFKWISVSVEASKINSLDLWLHFHPCTENPCIKICTA